MTFQLVRATDTEIAIWQTDHGHIYVYVVRPDGKGLDRRVMRAAPDSTVPPDDFADDALAFATREAEVRRMIRTVPQSSRTRHATCARKAEPVPSAGR